MNNEICTKINLILKLISNTPEIAIRKIIQISLISNITHPIISSIITAVIYKDINHSTVKLIYKCKMILLKKIKIRKYSRD